MVRRKLKHFAKKTIRVVKKFYKKNEWWLNVIIQVLIAILFSN